MELLPVSHKELIRRLKACGFEGPYTGGKHLMMVRAQRRIVIPNVHGQDIGIDLLNRILKQAAITREEWSRTK